MHMGIYGGGNQRVSARSSVPGGNLSGTQHQNVAQPLKMQTDYQWLRWRNLAIFLGIISAGSLSLGVADVILAYQRYMIGMNCSMSTALPVCNPSKLAFTWVASGIWGSILPFIFSLLAVRKSPTNETPIKRSHYGIICMLAAFIFTPAMIILSSIEAAMQYQVYYVQQGDQAKLALPIVVAILAFIEHIVLLFEIYYSCTCCRGDHVKQEVASQRRTHLTLRTPVLSQPAPPSQDTLELPYHPVGGRLSSQAYPKSYGGLSSHYFYSGSGGMGGRPTYINSYNPSFNQLGGQTNPAQNSFYPNSAYNSNQ